MEGFIGNLGRDCARGEFGNVLTTGYGCWIYQNVDFRPVLHIGNQFRFIRKPSRRKNQHPTQIQRSVDLGKHI